MYPPSFKPEVPESFQPEEPPAKPEMNFAVVNDKPINLIDTAKDVWNNLNEPLVKIPGSTPEFQQEHPVIAGAGDIITSLMSGLTSPLSIGLGAAGGIETAAAKAGMPMLARGANLALKAGSVPMAIEGAHDIVSGQGLGEKALGGLELAGGAFGMKHGVPEMRAPMPEIGINPSRFINQITPPTEESILTNKLLDAIKDSSTLNIKQKELYGTERLKRIKAFNEVPIGSQSDAQSAMGKLSGEYEKITKTPLQLGQEDVDKLFKLGTDRLVKWWDKPKLITGLTKVLNGQIPQNNELEVIRRAFGHEVADSLTNKIDRKSLVSELFNFPKAIRASYDLSAPLRQGLGLIHKAEYWQALPDMFKSLGSEKAFRDLQQSLLERPNYSLGYESGLHLTDLGKVVNREEQFMSRLADKIPGVKASERAYVGFLNKLRADTFDSLISDAIKAGRNPEEDLVLTREIAKFVNNATGRGSLGPLEKSAVELNNLFFSPRFIASRMQTLNPAYYVKADPFVRKEALKSLLALTAAGTTFVELGKLAGGEVEHNPTSSDFMKLKVGNTRLDPFGGYQQYIVLLSRLMSGEQTSSTSGKTFELGSKYGLPTRLDTAVNFGVNKLSPVPSVATDWLKASQRQPFTITNEAANLFVPMFMQDIYDIAKEDPKLLPLAVPAGFGMGVQTYGR